MWFRALRICWTLSTTLLKSKNGNWSEVFRKERIFLLAMLLQRQPGMLITWLVVRVHVWVHAQLGVCSNIQVIFSEAAIQMFMACISVFSSSTWDADFTELYEVSTSQVLKYIKSPLEYSSAIYHVNHSLSIYYPCEICWGCTVCHDLGHWWRYSLTP